MVETRPRATLIESSEARTRSAATINEALAGIADVFAAEWDIHRVSCRLLTEDRRHLVVAGVWSAAPGAIAAGVRMSVVASSLPELSAAGSPIVQERPQEDGTLLDAIFVSEGVRSWVSMPLTRAAEIAGVLSMSSQVEGTFRSEDVPFFVELAAAVQEKLLELAARSGNL